MFLVQKDTVFPLQYAKRNQRQAQYGVGVAPTSLPHRGGAEPTLPVSKATKPPSATPKTVVTMRNMGKSRFPALHHNSTTPMPTWKTTVQQRMYSRFVWRLKRYTARRVKAYAEEWVARVHPACSSPKAHSTKS
ncbi:hypothetical protein RvY_14375-1 [Ramazzottius varieornatus]|uniref:Uncharacterized protein n=1 Tax=Ramazzottius varieornatus TaxID=947166 RepID=A0A1D1VST3_RAMVA|nr:hypothetical protein RvY_14375-1 [Ramazzottius varieornatus]